MGDHKVKSATQIEERASFIAHLLEDVEAMQYMLDHNMFESGITRIGAEQEFCLVNEFWRPSLQGPVILSEINDPHFTTEIARFNLEINLDPVELKGVCFSEMHKELNAYLEKANNIATKHKNRVVLTGILPSISRTELEFDFMTPYPRYWALNESLKQARGSDFELHLKGVDELIVHHDSVLFEACNTSFQLHLQIDPDDFVSSYNWAQAISGPILGACTNSPILLGRELWNETRIALFQQSIDTRKTSLALRNQESRVTFGTTWGHTSVAEIYKNDITRFKILLADNVEEHSMEKVRKGEIPKLRALNLFNGTVYRWNRACYGASKGKAHLRIENRYIPSGPSTMDEMANFALWVGMMKGRPSKYDDIGPELDFRDAKLNFYRAAQSGRESVMRWGGESLAVKDLMRKVLLPIAYDGLEKSNIDKADIEYYLGIIEKRLQGKTGAMWTVSNYRSLKEKIKPDDALRALTKAIHLNQNVPLPVHEWPEVDHNILKKPDSRLALQIMSTQIFSVHENDQADLAVQIMLWNNIHHVPVESSSGNLVGLLTWTHIEELKNMEEPTTSMTVKDIMVQDPITVQPNTEIIKARQIMLKNKIGCLPVIESGILVGIITKNDLSKTENGESI